MAVLNKGEFAMNIKKNIIVSMTMIILTLCLQGTISSAVEGKQNLDYWDITKEYMMTNQNVTYHAYLSKDKKESWIFKADVAKDKKNVNVVIPDKIENAPVVMLGFISEFYNIYVPKLKIPGWDDKNMEEWEGYITFFGDIIEPWHGVTPQKVNVNKIIMPDSVETIGKAAFSYVSSLKYVYLSKQIKEINEFVFVGCKNLEKIDFPISVQILGTKVFQGCKKLAGLNHETKNLKNDTLTFSGNMVINQTEKTLIQVMPDAKKITIPKSVKWIEPAAFKNTSIKTLKVSKKNKYFAVHKRCLYRKAEKELVYVFGKGSKLILSKKIKQISEDVVVTKTKLKKLIISHKVKLYNNWKKPFVKNNKKIKIYYRGKRVK